MDKKKRGRPMASNDVCITPEFRNNPDIEKLGRALIAVAISIAQKKEAEEMTQSTTRNQLLSDENAGDDMT